jgi:hypothetical protein
MLAGEWLAGASDLLGTGPALGSASAVEANSADCRLERKTRSSGPWTVATHVRILPPVSIVSVLPSLDIKPLRWISPVEPSSITLFRDECVNAN